MASYNIPIKIQKLDLITEMWEDFYNPHAQINKEGGKEYLLKRDNSKNRGTINVSFSTFIFKIRYCKKIADIIFNTEMYRIVYNDKFFNVVNADRYQDSNEIIIKGEFNNGNQH